MSWYHGLRLYNYTFCLVIVADIANICELYTVLTSKSCVCCSLPLFWLNSVDLVYVHGLLYANKSIDSERLYIPSSSSNTATPGTWFGTVSQHDCRSGQALTKSLCFWNMSSISRHVFHHLLWESLLHVGNLAHLLNCSDFEFNMSIICFQ